MFDAFEPRVRALLVEFPVMPATVLAERVGWTGSPSWFRNRVALLRPELAPKDPADRLQYSPGDQVKCDLRFPRAIIPVPVVRTSPPPVVVSFSRTICAVMIPTRTTPDLLAAMWLLLSGSWVRSRGVWSRTTRAEIDDLAGWLAVLAC